MKHKIDVYIKDRLSRLTWNDKDLSNKTEISKAQINRFKNGNIERLTAEAFYKVFTAFGDSCIDATKMVYPDLKFTLNNFSPKQRNQFGRFMEQFEESKNSTKEIATKTGISEYRLKDLYYRISSPEANELLLIEKAIGKKQGELFELLYGGKKRK